MTNPDIARLIGIVGGVVGYSLLNGAVLLWGIRRIRKKDLRGG